MDEVKQIRFLSQEAAEEVLAELIAVVRPFSRAWHNSDGNPLLAQYHREELDSFLKGLEAPNN